MIFALSCAIGVFLVGFFLTILYSAWSAGSFPWFSEIHRKLMFWSEYDCCMKVTILIAFCIFFLLLLL